MHRSLLSAPLLLLLSAPSLSAQAPAAKPKPSGVPASRKPAAAPAKKMTNTPPSPAPLTTDDQKTIYSLGLSIYKSLATFHLTPAELDIVKRAMQDASVNKPELDLAQWGPKINGLAKARQKADSDAYLAKAASETGAEKTPSGLIYKELRPGTGASPKASDTVTVQYRGTLTDGTEFDSSYSRNQPAQFGLGQVIRCWTEGVAKMKVGGKATLVCPSDLAYGEEGRPPVIPPAATLIFDIELLDVKTS
jgi:FKBP-type peptidyl-prolyl cis-trans isomerase FkpA